MIWSGKIVFAFLLILCINSCSDIETNNEELIVTEPVVASVQHYSKTRTSLC